MQASLFSSVQINMLTVFLIVWFVCIQKGIIFSLLNDLRQRREEDTRVNEILKNSWNSSIHNRHTQQAEQNKWDNELGITVLEQLEGYPRCTQCFRKPENTGTTNLLTGTRYPTGCKLMN